MTESQPPTPGEPRPADPIATAILSHLRSVPANKPVSAEQVAQSIARSKTRSKAGEKPSPNAWRHYFQSVKDQARHLARTGQIEITRRGAVCNPDDLKGVWRMRLPRPKAG